MLALRFSKHCLLTTFYNGCLHPTLGGRWAANAEEQHDVIPAPFGWSQERGGAECPCSGPDRALLCGGRHRGQVGLVDGSAVWSATACFQRMKSMSAASGILDQNMPYPLSRVVVLVLIQSHLLFPV